MLDKSKALLLLTTCLSAGALHAQEDRSQFLGIVRIDAAKAQALLGNEEVTEEDLENRNANTTKDVFAGESSVTAGGGAAIAQKIYVNGLEESLLSVTIDGARQNKSAFHHTGNVLLDPELLKKVEISKGIAPADAGPGALAGQIAYETKDAADLLDPGKSFGGRVSLGYADNSDEWRASTTAYGMTGGFEWLLSVTRHKGDDYEDGKGLTVPGTEADLTDYMAKLAYTAEGGGRLEFAASQTEDAGLRSVQGGFSRPDFADVPGRGTTYERVQSLRNSYTLTYTDEQPEGWLSPTVQLSYNEQEIDMPGARGVNKSLSGVAKNKFDIGNGTLTAGLDFFHERAEGEQKQGGFETGREKMSSFGIFAQSRQDLNQHVSVSYGGRIDAQKFTGADDSEHEKAGISVNGAVDVILTDSLTLNAGIASNWGGYELGEAAIINRGVPWNYSGLTDSRANAARIGLRYEHGPWEASGALFYTRINDINHILPQTPGMRGAKDDIVSQGVNASLGYIGAKGFFRVNYTYADVELNGGSVETTSYYLGRPVGHIFALEGAYDVTDQIRLGGTAEIALENHDTPTTLPNYEVVNLYGSFTPRNYENLELRLDVRNVFDKTYSARSSDGIDFAGVIPLTEPGRTIGITAKLKF